MPIESDISRFTFQNWALAVVWKMNYRKTNNLQEKQECLDHESNFKSCLDCLQKFCYSEIIFYEPYGSPGQRHPGKGQTKGADRHISKVKAWISLVLQWIRIRLPMQGTQVQSLVWEDATCRRATNPSVTTTESSL